EIAWFEAPFRIGIPAPGAGAGAGRVDEDAVIAAGVPLHPGVAFRGEVAALDIVDAGAADARRRALNAPLEYVHRDQLALVLHHCGERERLAAGAGAEI